MEEYLQINRDYYLNACSYINASDLLMRAYMVEGLMEAGNEKYALQVWPMQYMLSLSAEMALKAGLVLHGTAKKELRSRKTGHDLEWLLGKYEEIVSEVDWLLGENIKSLNKGEFRYTEFFSSEAYIEPIEPGVFLPPLKKLLEKDNLVALGLINKSEKIAS